MARRRDLRLGLVAQHPEDAFHLRRPTMNKPRLLACPSCSRHVRMTEQACPFCASSLPETFAATPAPRAPTKRLNRGALYAFASTSITVAAACSSASTPAYGGAFPDDAALDATDAADDQADVGAVALYGAPAEPVDATDDVDAGSDDGPRAMPAYGAAALDATPG
jgi:hypothetical protein